MGDDLDGPAGRQAVAREVRTRLVDALDAVLGDRFRASLGRRPDPYREGRVITVHALGERCPRRATNPAQDYVDSVATTRRRVGLLALRRALVERGPVTHDGAPGQTAAARGATLVERLPGALDATLSDPAGWPPRLWEWASGLSPSARAAVSAGALTWCDGAVRLVGESDRVTWADPARTPRWDVPARAVALTAAFDARHGTPRTGERLLVISEVTSPSRRRLRAAHVALVHTLGMGRAPVRVTVASPAAGRTDPVGVDAALLELAADRVVEHLAYHGADALAPAVPGAGCRHCHLLDGCAEGRSHLGR